LVSYYAMVPWCFLSVSQAQRLSLTPSSSLVHDWMTEGYPHDLGNIHMYVCVCMYACMHACMHVCMSVYVCMHACMHVYVCMYNICIYIYVFAIVHSALRLRQWEVEVMWGWVNEVEAMKCSAIPVIHNSESLYNNSFHKVTLQHTQEKCIYSIDTIYIYMYVCIICVL
jgi:hypothetical protein